MKDVTKEWLQFAKSDLIVSQKSSDDEFLTNIVAFHCQQAVEKSFKALMEENGFKIPKIHNLVKLYSQLQDIINFDINIDVLNTLDNLYTSSRYPGNLGLMPDGPPTIKEINEMLLFANRIYEKILLILNEDKN